ncbi:MAG: hypothetical protein GC131_01025 [Alphaproteobacteria bacterium]|nr:hypothetical protein [Alphaproteobacteria bacterium]
MIKMATHDDDVATDRAQQAAVENLKVKMNVALAATDTYLSHLENKSDAQQKLEQELAAAKKLIDIDGDGEISVEEMQKALQNNPEVLVKVLNLQAQINALASQSDAHYQAFQTSFKDLAQALNTAFTATVQSGKATKKQKDQVSKIRDLLGKATGATASAGSKRGSWLSVGNSGVTGGITLAADKPVRTQTRFAHIGGVQRRGRVLAMH